MMTPTNSSLADTLRRIFVDNEADLVLREIEDPIERWEAQRLFAGGIGPNRDPHAHCVTMDDVVQARQEVIEVLARTHPDLAKRLGDALNAGLSSLPPAS